MQPAAFENVATEVWKKLAARDRAWQTPVLASVAAQGGDARMVVLRAADTDKRELTFFTDRHSRKLAQLGEHPGVCLLVFDQDARWQVRLYGTAAVIDDAAVLDRWWMELSDAQRGHYAVDVTTHKRASEKLHENGRENFAAFCVTVERFHSLWLDPAGNRAAEFEWHLSRWRGRPVQP